MIKNKSLIAMLILSTIYTQNLTFTENASASQLVNEIHRVYVGNNIVSDFGEFIVGLDNPQGFPEDFTIRLDLNEWVYDVTVSDTWYSLNQYRIDMDSDGTWELNWTSEHATTISFDYPEPANGISQYHSIKLELQYTDISGTTVTFIKTIPINIYAHPVFNKNNNDDVLVQLQANGNDLSQKKPLLFVEGFDPLNKNYPHHYYKLGETFINEELLTDDYAVFFLDFSDGGADMRFNAEVVLSALDYINTLCPDNEITLTGLSMGGVISRYALVYAEDNGIDHHVQTFVSFDSPQQGANINYAFQQTIALVPDDNPAFEGISKMQEALQSMAAKQLLVQNVYDVLESNLSGQEHNSFFNELNSMGLNGDGFPVNTYNIAVSNGNFNSAYDISQLDNPMVEISFVNIPGSNNDIEETIYPEIPDIGPGSTNPISFFYSREFAILSNIFPFIPGLNIIHSMIDWPEGSISINYDPVFIPTYSALDLQNVEYDGNYNIIFFGSTRFDEIITQDGTYGHPYFSIETGQLLKTMIENPKTEVVFKNEYQFAEIPNSSLSVLGLEDNIPSGESRMLFIDTNYSVVTDQPKFEDSSIMHHDWNYNESYKISNDFIPLLGNQSQTAVFKTYNNVSILTEAGEIQFRDPWFIENPEADPEDWVQPDTFRPLSEQGDGNGNVQVFLDQNYEFNDTDPIYQLKAPLAYHDDATGINYIFDRWKAYNSSGEDITGTGIFEDPQSSETQVVFTEATAQVKAFFHELTFTNGSCEVTVQGNDVFITAPDFIEYSDRYDVFSEWIIVSGTCTIQMQDSPVTNLTSISSDVELNIDYFENIVINGGAMTDWHTVQPDDDYYFLNGGFYMFNGLTVESGIATWDYEEITEIGSYILTGDQETHNIYNMVNVDINSDNVEISNNYLNLLEAADNITLSIITIPGGSSLERAAGDFEMIVTELAINGTPEFPVVFGEIADGSEWIFRVSESSDINETELTRGRIVINEGSNVSVRNSVINATDKFIEVETLFNDPVVDITFSHSEFENVNHPVYFNSIRNTQCDIEYINCTIITADDLVYISELPGQDVNDMLTVTAINNIVFNFANFIQAPFTEVLDTVTLAYTGYDSFSSTMINDICFSGAQNDFINYCNDFISTQQSDFVDFLNGDYHLQPDSPCIDAGDPNVTDPNGTVSDLGAYYYDAIPPVPVNLNISGYFGDHPTITWDAVSASDFDHYVLKTVYNGPNNNYTDYVSLTATSYMDMAFTIQKLGSDHAVYSVSSVDWIGQQSDYSASKSTTGSGGGIGRYSDTNPDLPGRYAIHAAYPNPFNPMTTIRYDLPASGQVDIMIYDMLGHEVTHLVNAVEAAGYHSVNWDASSYASGAYFVKMISGEFTQTQKLMLVK